MSIKHETLEQELKIGIPRALSYYTYYPFWFGFLSALGFEIVLSDKTTKAMMSSGSALVVSETCLPVKIYAGHILNLLDKGVDKILVPSIQSISPKIYNCSKIRGLPDLIKNVVKRDFTIIDATFDKSEKGQGLYEFLEDVVKPFGITDKKSVYTASKEGWRVYNNFNVMMQSGMDYEKALKTAVSGKIIIGKDIHEYPINVALIAHGYNLYDERISMKLIDKLKKLDVKAYTPLNLSREQMKEGFQALEQSLYWANEYEMSGAAGHYLQNNKIDGIITLTAFGCGPDSMMIERISRRVKHFNKPLLNLTVDEHTGEAGFVTRIEAFVDMLFRKKRAEIINKIDIPEETTPVVQRYTVADPNRSVGQSPLPLGEGGIS